MVIQEVVKRDGRIVPFDRARIVRAIYKALCATGRDDQQLAERLADQVVESLEQRFVEKRPHVEEIQDTVEQVLVKNGLYEVAKAYILYRQKRSEIREIKRFLGVVDDMKLTVNAITVLRSRYLLRDERGKIIETPKQMVERVARHIGLVDVIYHERVYDKEGKQPSRRAGEVTYKLKRAKINEYDLKMLKRAYNRLGQQGYMKVDFNQLLQILDEEWDRLYEETIDTFTQVMLNRYFLPNSPTLMNAGAPLGQLSACFVIPVDDSIDSIFEAIKEMALVQKSGGGTGFSFSRLRPRGDIVGTTKGVASGPVSFMRIFDVVTEVIKQGGKRRGANMGVLHISHPDIEEFIQAKADLVSFQNFNISVAVDDAFMKAVENDDDYALVNPRTKETVRRVKARSLFDIIVFNAWRTGDPGLLFIDHINKHNPTPHLGKIEATNPCGEQPLLPHESCNLGSINLSLMVKKTPDGRYEVDWRKLREVVHIATHFLDNVIDANNYPVPAIEEATLRTRKIGLGVMGWAELLFKLRIPYDSEEALRLARRIMEFINYHSKLASIELAKRRGPFPAFKGSVYEKGRMPFEADDEEKQYSLDWNRIREEVRRYGIRNATTTTIAPTGTISIIAGTSSGIEPVFALSFVRRVLGGARLFETNAVFEEIAKEEGFYSEELMRQIAKTGTLRGAEVPEWARQVFKTALEIDVEWHVYMQAAFQEFTDNAVSKTINLPYEAAPEDVKRAFLLAYKLKCKGITVYRYGSKGEQVLYVGGAPAPESGYLELDVGAERACPVCA